MSYTPVPTFADGAILTAADLNILADNIEFLHSLVSGVNVPFTSDTITGTTGTLVSSRNYAVRYVARYLHIRARITSGESESVEFLIDEVSEYSDTVDRTALYQWDIVVDLTAIGTPPTLLDWLSVRFVVDFNVGGNVVLDYILQSDAATL